MSFTYSNELVSDLHKDAYGYRPREGFMSRWNEATDAERQEQWDWMIQVMERNMEEEAQAEKASIAKFEELVETTIQHGAADRKTAINWILDASDCYGDLEHLCYQHGLPYNYLKEI